jgi:hypothetical protein
MPQCGAPGGVNTIEPGRCTTTYSFASAGSARAKLTGSTHMHRPNRNPSDPVWCCLADNTSGSWDKAFSMNASTYINDDTNSSVKTYKL